MGKTESLACWFLTAFFASCLASYLLQDFGGSAALPAIALWMITSLLAVSVIVSSLSSLLRAALHKTGAHPG